MTKPPYRKPNYGFVYAMRHNPTQKVYIGLTTRNPEGRLKNHIKNLRANRNTALAMQEDFNKFGEDYSFFILERIPTSMYVHREMYWQLVFRTYDPLHGYNHSMRDAKPPDLEDFEEYTLEWRDKR